MRPFFSVIIPTYNRSVLLLQGINSILGQSFNDFEIIVVDDGSTDDTESVIKTIPSDKIFYFKKLNEERGAARNFGIERAKGDYLVFMDSDDLMLSNHLSVLHAHLAIQPEDLIATKYLVFDKQNKEIPYDVKSLVAGYHGYQTFLIGNPLACCFTARRENPNLIRFKEELKYTIMEDWIFLMENLQFSKLYLVDEVTMSMRDHDERSMRSNTMRIIHARQNALVYIVESIKIQKHELRLLEGNSEYFCAVHAYIGVETKMALNYLKKSVVKTGLTINALLLFIRLCLQMIWRS